MHLLFDEAGKFMVGRILSETDSSAQVELTTGKRVKVKSARQLLRFETPEPLDLLTQAETEAATIDPALAWEFAPEAEFSFADLASDYFGSDKPGAVQQAAALLALHGAPHYFKRAGKGQFRKTAADVVEQALAAIEKKRQVAAQIDAWADTLAHGECPPPVAEQLYKILFKPDKNAPEYKAVLQAARATQTAPLTLLANAGAIQSAYQFHWQRFLFEQFPQGTGFPTLAVPNISDDLPLADVAAFSIDDADTTEIDDAMSLQGLGSGSVVLGIHIAAPGLAIQPDDAIDKVCRQRLSTVYMPGCKLTMLPTDVMQAFTLEAGSTPAAVSLYLTVNENTLKITDSQTRLERVPIAANLRHNQLESAITADWLQAPVDSNNAEPLDVSGVTHDELAFLHRLAQHLKTRREQVRGKPENFTRPDYSFRLIGGTAGQPTGEEQVEITTRQRGAPLDLIVSELMILAGSTWGDWLKQLGIPAIYRSQASMAPGIKVRMSTKALPHAGMGVSSYCWSTSPLRRYVDLVNQWQIIAAAQHGTAAALVAPFKPKDTALFAIISAFDAAYSAYGSQQASMERYWALRWLQQNNVTELNATLLREQTGASWLARADTLPLVFTVIGTQTLVRGVAVRIKLGAIDLLSLDVNGTIEAVLMAGSSATDTDDEDEGDNAGPVAVAMDVGEAETPETSNSNDA